MSKVFNNKCLQISLIIVICAMGIVWVLIQRDYLFLEKSDPLNGLMVQPPPSFLIARQEINEGEIIQPEMLGPAGKEAYPPHNAITDAAQITGKLAKVKLLPGQFAIFDAFIDPELWSQVYAPYIINGTVYLWANNGNLRAIDINTKRQLWEFNTDTLLFSTCVESEGVIYFFAVQRFRNYLYAIDAVTGQEKWKFTNGETTSATNLASPIISEGAVFYEDWDNGALYAMDSITGQMKWQYKAEGIRLSSPSTDNGLIYLRDNQEYLYALETQTGKEAWRVRINSE